ncbi:hypothetical protein [Polaromonas sp. JS666]|uniref:hypothetical protein n=1 Tax=Polaromonas sp. (strain JS666 / ATCC BAA-500) TaxID=296591 RepID=UPI00088B0A1E|nr:hypothetical protein [Polaromonas sp. JS666]SDM45796.1 hypothetical protein SAMN05720382_101420 [Polaromonas sp. JS666]
MSTPAASLADMPMELPPYSGPRRLDDDVFQTAEEAVLVEGQGSAAALPLPPSGPAATGSRGFPFMQAVRAHVAARPCQSALLAAAAGALAMLALRSQLRGRLQLPRRSRLR